MMDTLSKTYQTRGCATQKNHSASTVKSVFNFKPLANISQTMDGWNIEIAVPGYQREDIQIEIQERNMQISCASATTAEGNDKKYTNGITAFERHFHLPENANSNQIKAQLIQGILQIFIPVEEKESIKINIK